MDPPGDTEVGATEQRVPAIVFPKSDRVDAPRPAMPMATEGSPGIADAYDCSAR